MGDILDGKFVVKIVDGQYVNDDAVDAVIGYIGREGNNHNIGGTGFWPINMCGALDCFKKVQQAYDVTQGRHLWHIIISPDSTWFFKENDLIIISDRICNYFSSEYQVFFGIHSDERYLHIHLAINSVNYRNGKRLKFIDIEELRAFVKKQLEQYAIEKYFKEKEKE